MTHRVAAAQADIEHRRDELATLDATFELLQEELTAANAQHEEARRRISVYEEVTSAPSLFVAGMRCGKTYHSSQLPDVGGNCWSHSSHCCRLQEDRVEDVQIEELQRHNRELQNRVKKPAHYNWLQQ